jgi:HSP20 family protein
MMKVFSIPVPLAHHHQHYAPALRTVGGGCHRETLSSSSYLRDRRGYDVIDQEHELILSVDLPGVRAADLDVTVEGSEVQIAATRRTVSSVNGETTKKARIFRRFEIDTDSVDATKLTANLSDGVLLLVVPKKVKPGPRVVPITTFSIAGTPSESRSDSANEEGTSAANAPPDNVSEQHGPGETSADSDGAKRAGPKTTGEDEADKDTE